MNDVRSPQELTKEAEQQFRIGNLQCALNLYQKALEYYLAVSDQLAIAELKNNLSVILLRLAQPQDSYNMAFNTDLIFKQYGDRRRQAMALGNLASACDALGKNKEAIRYYQESSDILKELGEQEMRSYVLQNLANLQLRSGHYLDALLNTKIALDYKKNLTLKQKFLYWLVKIPFRMLNPDSNQTLSR